MYAVIKQTKNKLLGGHFYNVSHTQRACVCILSIYIYTHIRCIYVEETIKYFSYFTVSVLTSKQIYISKIFLQYGGHFRLIVTAHLFRHKLSSRNIQLLHRTYVTHPATSRDHVNPHNRIQYKYVTINKIIKLGTQKHTVSVFVDFFYFLSYVIVSHEFFTIQLKYFLIPFVQYF